MSQTEYQEKPANSGWRGASSWMQNRALDIEGLAGLPLPSILIRWARSSARRAVRGIGANISTYIA